MSQRKKSIYIVLRGRQPGVYSRWDGLQGAQAQVEGFGGAVYKGFFNLEEAINWVKEQPADQISPPIKAWLAEQCTSPRDGLNEKIESHLEQGGVVIFTDGSASGNPGRGGYGAVIIQSGKREEISGGFLHTTNNRMELYACIAALERLPEPARVLLITDSAYVARAFSEGWLQQWERRGWRRRDGEPVENPDLWQQLDRLCKIHSVEFHWIKGHNARPENERCDQLASSAARKTDLLEDKGYLVRR